MCLVHYFAMKAPEEAISSRIALGHVRFARSTDDAHEGLESYAEVEKYVLATYVTDDVIT